MGQRFWKQELDINLWDFLELEFIRSRDLLA